ncbi:hypothetical protein RRG08_029947 [Elysia crispata]|uniref:Uncharacterized protein n=1 Tax=Elysia crispata TaxID=231223 RepID=A0AAE0ZKU3_9GAST|nr:hypothetical protein RRG08_029947 [Elysia crispata]
MEQLCKELSDAEVINLRVDSAELLVRVAVTKRQITIKDGTRPDILLAKHFNELRTCGWRRHDASLINCPRGLGLRSSKFSAALSDKRLRGTHQKLIVSVSPASCSARRPKCMLIHSAHGHVRLL